MNLIRIRCTSISVLNNVRYLNTANHKSDELSVFHRERKVIGYSRELIFELVKDVANYKHFVPFCLDSEIIECEKNMLTLRRTNGKEETDANKTPKVFKAQMVVGFAPFKESYVSTVSYVKPDYVQTLSQNTNIFEYIAAEWKFLPFDSKSNAVVLNEIIDKQHDCCVIDFNVSFRFNSIFYSQFSSLFLDSIFKQMVNAFVKRAEEKYGKIGNKLLKN
jgi:coenzyme Q-binding protein COQ10